MQKFVEHEAFEEIKKRCVFVFVDMPGHEDGAEDLPESFNYPTIQQLGEDLVTILDQLRIKYVIGIGNGAGANILTRFGMMHSSRCLGLLLLNPTSNKTTMAKNFMDRVSKWKVAHLTPSGENLALFRKFGHKLEEAEDKASALEELRKQFGMQLNKKNVQMFCDAFANRTDITPMLSKNLKCDALLIVGAKSSQVVASEHMHQYMDKTKTSLLKVDDVANLLEESPFKLSNAILLFCKGLGWLTSVNLPGVGRRSSVDSQGKPTRQRSISMEDYDKPNIRRLSISSGAKE